MVGYKGGREVNGGSGSKGGTCHNDKPGEQMEGGEMMERK